MVLGWYLDLAKNDTDAVAELLSLSDDVVVIGTDPDEVWVGGANIRAIVKRQMQQVGKVNLDPGEVMAFEEGSVGWAIDSGTMGSNDGTMGSFRGAFVLHREEGNWKIVMAHFSNATSNREALGRDLTTSLEDVADLIEDERPDLSSAASQDGTVTIMFTDVVGSTALNEALGDKSFVPLLMKHNEIVEARTKDAGGTVVKSQGDGFMLVFASARRGVECATAIQRDVSKLDHMLKVRMGLHTGEPTRQAEDFYGRDVAYAARIGAVAGAGEILVSSLVKSLVEPSGSVQFDGPRELVFKGFDGGQLVYSVLWR